jgi:hypothetical protein
VEEVEAAEDRGFRDGPAAGRWLGRPTRNLLVDALMRPCVVEVGARRVSGERNRSSRYPRTGRRARPSAYPVAKRGDGRGKARHQAQGHRGVLCSSRTRVNRPVERPSHGVPSRMAVVANTASPRKGYALPYRPRRRAFFVPEKLLFGTSICAGSGPFLTVEPAWSRLRLRVRSTTSAATPEDETRPSGRGSPPDRSRHRRKRTIYDRARILMGLCSRCRRSENRGPAG